MTYRGINLGGWLVLERWMTPSLFEGMAAKDEYELCQALGSEAVTRLHSHRKTFITHEDLRWIAAHGLNAIRVPVPHWVYGGYEPFIPCIEQVRWVVDTAAEHGLQVLLDLHTAPGSQNGNDHSGRSGTVGWNVPEHKAATLAVLQRLTKEFGTRPTVLGIEVLNEPHQSLPINDLHDFYDAALRVMRAEAPNCSVIVHDSFRPDAWHLERLHGTTLDMHLYQVFSEADKRLPIHKHIRKARNEWDGLITDISSSLPVIIGEWSLGLDNRTFRGMDDYERDKAMQAYGRAQLEGFSRAHGWFFWSYKTETMAGWSYRDAVARGWLPSDVSAT